MAVELKRSRKKWWARTYSGDIVRFPDGEVVCDDALKFLGSLRKESADIVFIDPPFNLGKSYGQNGAVSDNKSETEYLEYMTEVISCATTVLRPGGAMYLYHIPKWAIRLSNVLEKHLDFKHWIAISMKNGFARGQSLYPAHYALLFYTKGRPSSFFRPKIPKPICARCGKDLRDYGGYKKFVEKGINLSDIWDDISPVRHKQFKFRRNNELPLKLVSRILDISGTRRGLVVDPFSGTGSMLVASRKAGMQFVACEIEQEYVRKIEQRLELEVEEHKTQQEENAS
ncbi:MAG TPA: site-specific DNA-methyltransferase [Aridibacter sp.]|nr:site-specific DNA-methyltransferase [Aridibacter sp.]